MRTQWIPANTEEAIEIHECEDQFFFEPNARKEINKYLGGEFEFVTVLYEDKPRYMLTNEIGALECLPINPRATAIYHNAERSRGRDWLGAPYIHGDVILVEEQMT